MPGRIGALIKFAAIAGPTIYKVVKNYGPTILKLANQHPQAFERVQSTVKRLGNAGGRGGSRGLTKRLEEMRVQVRYLIASADDEAELRQAGQWKKQLDRIEQGLPLLEPMSPGMARKERKILDRKLDLLAADILEKYISENAEDAEVGDTRGEMEIREEEPKIWGDANT